MKRVGHMVQLFAAAVLWATVACARVSGLRTGGPVKAAVHPPVVAAKTHSEKHGVELAIVLAKSVSLMNSGIKNFLKEEADIKSPAMTLLQQVASDFDKLRIVAQKLHTYEQHRDAHSCTGNHSMSDIVKERDELKTTVKYLLKKSQTCDDKLKTAQSAAASCGAMAEKQVKAKADFDERKVQESQDESEMLRKSNEELKEENEALTKRMAALQGSPEDKAAARDQELQDLRKQVANLKADKQGLVDTVNHFVKTNGTEALSKSLRTEVDTVRKQELQAEDLAQKQIAKLQDELKLQNEKDSDLKEVAESLQQENLKAQQANEKLQGQVQTLSAAQKSLEQDKMQILETLQGSLRENTHLQQELSRIAGKHPAPPKESAPAAKQPAARAVTSETVQQDSNDDPVATMGETSQLNRYINMNNEDLNQAAVDADNVVVVEAKKQSVRVPTERKSPNSLGRWLREGTPHVHQESTPSPAVREDEKEGEQVEDLLSQAQQAVDDADQDNKDGNAASDDDSDATAE